MKPTRLELKRPHAIALAAIGLSAGVLTSGFGTAGANDRGPGDLAVGSAVSPYPTTAGPGFAHLSVSAHSEPSGLDPRGHVHVRGSTGAPMGAFTVSGPVTCLRVEGNKAAIKYRFSQASGSAATFKNGGIEIFIEENGPPRDGQPVDEVAFQPPQPAGVFDPNAGKCADPKLANYEKVNSGNYTVNDRDQGTASRGSPRPTRWLARAVQRDDRTIHSRTASNLNHRKEARTPRTVGPERTR